jgi:hypothetical protein
MNKTKEEIKLEINKLKKERLLLFICSLSDIEFERYLELTEEELYQT